MIHAVGRASPRAPRLIDLRWGETGPMLTLVGKGVCFDTGGLNLKPGASMGLMKKDMGGAATVLGLAHMIMQTGANLRLRVLIPAVENAVSGDSFRPGDILSSRKGLSVEINNTDAEGRLVLADALALADEERPDLLICMATLTGAARVALGPDLPPFYTEDDALAASLSRAAQTAADPLWRMPFWTAYESKIEPGIADLDNAPSGGMAGSITAALFLRRFVTQNPAFRAFRHLWLAAEPGPRTPQGRRRSRRTRALHRPAGDPVMSDPRRLPFSGTIAHVSLRGQLAADSFTQGTPASITRPLTDLCPQPGSPRDRQLLFGAGVTVIDARETHSFVQADWDGYCGWVANAALGPVSQASHVVTAPATHLYREASIKRGEVMALSMGSPAVRDRLHPRLPRHTARLPAPPTCDPA